MEISSVLVFFFLIPLFIFLFYYQKPAKKPTPGEFQTYLLLGILPQLLKNRHRFLEGTTEALIKNPSHAIVFQSLGQDRGIQIANPSNNEHMLKTNFKNYPKGKRTTEMLEDFLGHGIFNSDGEHWNLQRKAASFEFNARPLRNFGVDTVQHERA